MKKAITKPVDRKARDQGMNWIRQEKRLAIYLRDGLACNYCGHSVEDGAQLSLDHIVPHSRGGSNKHTNLVTSCCRCNSSRGDRGLPTWAKAVAAYVNHGITAKDVTDRVRHQLRQPLPTNEAKTLIARRGSVAKVLSKVTRK